MPQLVMREAIKKGLEEALQNDPNVLILGEDIGAYGGAYAVSDGFLDKFGPERIKDTAISEATFIGTGIGAASAGLRPIIELMSISFSLVGFNFYNSSRLFGPPRLFILYMLHNSHIFLSPTSIKHLRVP